MFVNAREVFSKHPPPPEVRDHESRKNFNMLISFRTNSLTLYFWDVSILFVVLSID